MTGLAGAESPPAKKAVPRWASIGLALAGLTIMGLLSSFAGQERLRAWAVDWYGFLNNLYLFLGVPLNNLARQLTLPLLPAVLLGMVAALSPCQLSTGAAALAYLAPGSRRQTSGLLSLGAYAAGKVLVYSLLGGAVLGAGLRANESIPVIQVVRQALGPLMLLMGLYFLGAVRFQFILGQGLGQWLEQRFAGGDVKGAFALGVAFALAFCPTLFLLFFSLLLPLALGQPLGLLYPALFALGTVVPLLAVHQAVQLGLGSTGRAIIQARKLDKTIRVAAAAVLLLFGLNDTVVYWLL